MFNHWVVPCNGRCFGFLGNMGGSTNPVAQLTLPSPIWKKIIVLKHGTRNMSDLCHVTFNLVMTPGQFFCWTGCQKWLISNLATRVVITMIFCV